MRKAEIKDLYVKLTKYIGKKIDHLTAVEGWTIKELSEKTGITHTRLTEIKNFDKYQRAINESYLAAFIGEKIITVEELMKNAKLTEKEKEHLKGMKFYENHALRKKIQQLEEKGVDVMSLLDKELKKQK